MTLPVSSSSLASFLAPTVLRSARPSLLLIFTTTFITRACHFLRSAASLKPFPLSSAGSFLRGLHQRAKPDHEHPSSSCLCPAAQLAVGLQVKPGRPLDAHSSHSTYYGCKHSQALAKKALSSGKLQGHISGIRNPEAWQGN